MAKNKVAFEVIVTSKGFKVVESQQKKLGQNIDNTEKKTKNLDKTQQKNYGRQKQGIIQTANQTKNFSKLSQTIGGSGGTSLVGAYATLAANVFAATAMFNALSRAADFQKLREGLEIIGNQSGRSLGILAENLREATGMALTLEEASSAAALGISGGFGGAELEGLAKVAKGAALTLGRSLPDAFDRLTRGAIKLEPEILDELGIMVRLDDAVEKYAAQLGKGVNSLTQMERRQAFMNEILEQGAAKFGDIADATDSTAYAKLGATFGDLTTDIFTFLNESTKLNFVVNLLAGSTTALLGTMLIFGSTIATQIVPALGQMAEKASGRAAQLAGEAKALQSSAKLEMKILTKKTKGFKMGAASYTNAKKMEGTATQKLEARIKSLTKSQKLRQANITKGFKGDKLKLELKKQELLLIDKQIAKETKLLNLQKGGGKLGVGAALAKADAKFAKKGAKITQQFTGGEIGLGAALSSNFKNWDKSGKKKADALKSSGMLTKANGKLGSAFKLLGSSLGLLVAGFVKFLPLIGAVTVAIGIAILAFNKFYNTKERKEYNKSMKNLETILESLPKKAEEYHKALKAAGPASLAQVKETAILSNSIKEINAELKTAIRLRKELRKAGKDDNSITDLSRSDKTMLEGKTTTSTSGMSYTTAAMEPISAIENMLATELPIIAGKAKKTFASLLRIDDSPEFESLKGILTSDIPGYADAARAALGPAMQDLADGKVKSALGEIAKVVAGVEERFGKLAGAVAGFAMSLKDAEKTGSKFIQKFLPKTQASDILGVFSGFRKEIKLLKDEASVAQGILGPDGKLIAAAGASAAQFSGAGSAVTTLLGGEFDSQRKSYNEAKKEFDRVTKIEAESTGFNPWENARNKFDIGVAQKKLDEEGVKLEEVGTKATEATYQVILKTQRAELEKKKILERINGLKKIEKSLMGTSTNAFMVQNKSLDDTVALRKTDFNLSNQILGNSLNLTEEEMKKGNIMDALIAKSEITGDNAITESEQASISLALQEEKNIALQEELNIGQKAFNQANSILAVDKLALKLLQKKTQFDDKARKIQIANTSARSGSKTTDPITALRETMKIEEGKFAIAKAKAKIELESARIQQALLVSQLTAFKKMMGADNKKGTDSFIDFDQLIVDSNATFSDLSTQLTLEVNKGAEDGIDLLAKHFQDVFGSDLIDTSLSNAISAAFLTSTGTIDTLNEQLLVGASGMRDFGDSMVEIFGEEGAVIGALSNFIATIAEVGPKLKQSFDAIATAEAGTFDKDGNSNDDGISKKTAGLLKFAAAAQAVGGVIAGFAQVLAADSKQKIGEVDKQIEAEKRLDGKSKESLQKIATMEAKKEGIARKAFETNKKLQIAQAIISTASGAAMALTLGPILGPILAGMIVALGMAQINMIKKTTFQGGGAGAEKPASAINIGGARSNKVDVSQGASSGETAYLRGGSGVGSNANNFTPGGAMGRKGYAAGGMLVGERGPEVVTKEEIIPNYALSTGNNMNLTFNVSALDGASVQEVLTNNQGAVVGAIRDAANSYGQDFLPDVNVGYGGDG